MKKIFSLTAAFAVALGLGSCSSDEDTFHYFGIDSDLGSGVVQYVYADQSGDTIRVRTTDSFDASTDASWLRFAENGSSTLSKNVKYVYGGIESIKVPVVFDVNNSSERRVTAVDFVANGHRSTMVYVQLYYHRILTPAPTFTNEDLREGAVFSKVVESSTTTDSIAFTLYDNATLSSSDEWLSVPEQSYAAGTHTVYFNMEPNNTLTDRTAHITLRSANGAKSVINITQK